MRWTSDLEVGGSSLVSAVVLLDKKLYSTLPLFTQVHKWTPTILGGKFPLRCYHEFWSTMAKKNLRVLDFGGGPSIYDNEHYDIDISDKLIFCKDRSTGHNLRKNATQDLVPNLSRTNGFKYSFFNRIVNEWNSLPNHIREVNCIATFKRNVLSFLTDN